MGCFGGGVDWGWGVEGLVWGRVCVDWGLGGCEGCKLGGGVGWEGVCKSIGW